MRRWEHAGTSEGRPDGGPVEKSSGQSAGPDDPDEPDEVVGPDAGGAAGASFDPLPLLVPLAPEPSPALSPEAPLVSFALWVLDGAPDDAPEDPDPDPDPE